MKNSMEGKVQSKVPGEHTRISTLSSVSRGQEGSSFSLTMSFLSPPLRVTALTPSRSVWRCSLIQSQLTRWLKFTPESNHKSLPLKTLNAKNRIQTPSVLLIYSPAEHAAKL